MIKFQARIREVSNSYVVTVPRQYVENGIVSKDKILTFVIEGESDE